MQDNQYSLSQKKQEQISPDYVKILHEENQKLILENAELKRSLEKEEFLHRNLYKQWTELNARTLTKDHEVKQLDLRRTSFDNFYKYSFYALLLIAVVFAWYLLKENKNSASPQTQQTTMDTTIADALPVQQSSPEKNIRLQRDTVPAKSNPALVNESSQTKSQVTRKNLRYRVTTKTFFYNKPAESTQRSIFLLPAEGAYGIITALDDQNGFIYIIFTNHAGRTSKGWIRKIDLEPIN